MNIIQRAEALAKTMGTDVDHIWQEFEEWFKARFAKPKAKTDATTGEDTPTSKPDPTTLATLQHAAAAQADADAAAAPGTQTAKTGTTSAQTGANALTASKTGAGGAS